MSIPNNFPDLLRECCLATTDEIFNEMLPKHGFTTVHESNQRYALRVGATKDAPMLLCHADTVRNGGAGPHPFSIEGTRVNSIALDDRLGLAILLWSIYNLVPNLGSCSMLVCDEEEVGRSTAKIFKSDLVEPNWLMEFDRRGTDVVCYKYTSELFTSLIKHAGFSYVGNGSVSDISYLDLGVVGMNVGVGYHSEHSDNCYANLTDTYAQMKRAIKFYEIFHKMRLEHKKAYTYGGYSGYSNSSSKTYTPSTYKKYYGDQKKSEESATSPAGGADGDFDLLDDPFKAGSHTVDDYDDWDDDAYTAWWKRRGYEDSQAINDWRSQQWQDVEDDEDTVVVDEADIRKLVSDSKESEVSAEIEQHSAKFQGVDRTDFRMLDECFHWENDVLYMDDQAVEGRVD